MKSDTEKSREIGVGGFEVSDLARQYVNQVLDSGRLSYGKFSREFEEQFASRHEVKYAVCCNSGTSAIHVALACLKEVENWRDGDEVIVPAVTFVATSNMVILNGLKPVFVDIDPRTYNIDPQKIEERISDRTRAIIPVHLFGQPCAMDVIMEIASRRGLKVIEDSAETMFARYKGKPVGSWGDIACFSTYVAHLLITGVGGLAVTSNPEYAVILKSLVNHGRDSIYFNIDDKGETAAERMKIAEGRFRFVRFGHSFRLTEFETALGLAQLAEADEQIRDRKEKARILIEGLEKHSAYLQLPYWPEEADHVFMMFPIVIRDEQIKKLDLISHLENRGVETRDMLPLLNQPIYIEKFGNLEAQYPVAQWVNNSGFYIGCHPQMALEDLQYIIEQFDLFFIQEKNEPQATG